jgi:hypothetical protein
MWFPCTYMYSTKKHLYVNLSTISKKNYNIVLLLLENFYFVVVHLKGKTRRKSCQNQLCFKII